MSDRYEYVKLAGRDDVVRTRRVLKAKSRMPNLEPTVHDTLMIEKAEMKRERRRARNLDQLLNGGYR